MTTETVQPAKRKAKARPRVDRLPPFRVLLHNDDHNDMIYVTRTIAELTPHSRFAAMRIMLAAHLTGVSLLVVTHRERAELYRDQFTSKGLTATIEPAN